MKKIAALLLLSVVACGKRGDPKPPVPIIPKPASDLVVTQRGDNVILSWSYPSLTTAGKSLDAFRRVTVYRYTEELPAPAAGRDPNSILPGDVDPTLPPAVAMFAKLPAIGPAQFLKLKQRLDSIESANLPGATTGARLTYEDTPPFHSSDGRPVRLNYAVVIEADETESALSNLATLVPVDVPVAPANLTASARQQGVVLSWSKPEATITGAEKPFVTGYNIYRMPAGQAGSTPAIVNTAPVAAMTYTDAPPYGAFTYSVTAVTRSVEPKIESDPSTAVTVTFKDLLPPPAPASITALVEPHAVRLLWDAVEAADLASYKIYRTEGIGHSDIREAGTIPIKTVAAGTMSAVDPSADLGIAYRYGVAAVDKSGNESAVVRSDWVVVPKTP